MLIIPTINHNSHFYLRYFRGYLCLLHWLQMISLPLAIYQPATSGNGHYNPQMHHPPIFNLLQPFCKEWFPWPWPLWPRTQCPLYNFRRCDDQQKDIESLWPCSSARLLTTYHWPTLSHSARTTTSGIPLNTLDPDIPSRNRFALLGSSSICCTHSAGQDSLGNNSGQNRADSHWGITDVHCALVTSACLINLGWDIKGATTSYSPSPSHMWKYQLPQCQDSNNMS